ncbi:hypothetical protein BpHYR1_020996 [Brachionus plicatilis]|uniref:SWIM-type domain-containing protein n=1 Tax=Brachionus plicatilis TaxID=10195 RepID=A0A3M7QL28_BRAPC|nr:hypothetical protein BpHYR1_020996 [Brachionus plicatilis]
MINLKLMQLFECFCSDCTNCTCYFFLDKAFCYHIVACCLLDDINYLGLKDKQCKGRQRSNGYLLHSAKDSNTFNASYAILSPLLLFGNGWSSSSSVSFPSLAAKISSTSHIEIEVDINQKITSAIFDAASASVPKFFSKKLKVSFPPNIKLEGNVIS